MAAILEVLAQVIEAAKGGTAPQVAVAMRKYRKLRLMLACTQEEEESMWFMALDSFATGLNV